MPFLLFFLHQMCGAWYKDNIYQNVNHQENDVHQLSLKGRLEVFSPEACLIMNTALEYSTSFRIIVYFNFKMVFKGGHSL